MKPVGTIAAHFGLSPKNVTAELYSASIANGDGSKRMDVAPGRVVYVVTNRLGTSFQTLSGKTFPAGSTASQTIDAATGDTLVATLTGNAQ
jgi:hypothetical protein